MKKIVYVFLFSLFLFGCEGKVIQSDNLSIDTTLPNVTKYIWYSNNDGPVRKWYTFYEGLYNNPLVIIEYNSNSRTFSGNKTEHTNVIMTEVKRVGDKITSFKLKGITYSFD